MSEQSELRQANDEEVLACQDIGESMVTSLMQLSPNTALTVLVYVVTTVVMQLNPTKGQTRISAIDKWFDAVRKSIEANEALERGGRSQ